MTTTTEAPIVRGAGYRLSTSAGGTHDPVLIDLGAIRTDGGTQARAGLDEPTVQEYAATWQDLSYQQNGLSKIPPIVLYHDGESYWLADGFHRVEAYKRFLAAVPLTAAPRALLADVQSGTRRDAVLYACGANAGHGLRRTNADKRRAVERLLRDEEWRQWSDREIARRCNVSDMLVATIRRDLYPQELEDSRTVARNGTTYQQKPPAPAGWTCDTCGTIQTGMHKPSPPICTSCAMLVVGQRTEPHKPDTKEPPPPAAAIPHLPPDFADAQRRAEKIGLTLSMDMDGRFDVRNPAAGVGLVGFRDWPAVLAHLTKMEEAAAKRDRIVALVAAERAAPAPAPAPPTADWRSQVAALTDLVAALCDAADWRDRAGVVRAALSLASAAAGDRLEDLADALDDREYEALAAYRRSAP